MANLMDIFSRSPKILRKVSGKPCLEKTYYN